MEEKPKIGSHENFYLRVDQKNIKKISGAESNKPVNKHITFIELKFLKFLFVRNLVFTWYSAW